MRTRFFTFLTYYIIVRFVPCDGRRAASGQRCLAMPTEDEDCQSPISKWFYSKIERRCVNFMYGDCPVEGNIFNSKEECDNTCKDAGAGQHPVKPGGGPVKGRPGHQRPSRQHASSEENDGRGSRHSGRKGSEEDTNTVRVPPRGHGGNRQPHRPSRPHRPRPPVPKPHRPAGGVKHRPRPPLPHPGKGSCGARPKRGNCDENADLWFNNGNFMTCSRVPAGRCPTVGSFFESCEDCMQKCRPHQLRQCQFKT
ncbi:papilin-like isoform X2 [Dermacentor albipictus]|uniref:papilin-like isoform X2 n=2 Tax=Dermacentor albipictus TaxID=60249 RepID=UPI0031FBDDD6